MGITAQNMPLRTPMCPLCVPTHPLRTPYGPPRTITCPQAPPSYPLHAPYAPPTCPLHTPYVPLCAPTHPYVPPTHPLRTPYMPPMHPYAPPMRLLRAPIRPLHAPYVPLCTPTCPLCAPTHPQLVSHWLRFSNVPTTANQITGIDQAHYNKILIFFLATSLKCLRAARIDELADSNEPAINEHEVVILYLFLQNHRWSWVKLPLFILPLIGSTSLSGLDPGEVNLSPFSFPPASVGKI